MIINLVSRCNGAGKSQIADVLQKNNIACKAAFASALHNAAKAFMPEVTNKYEVDDELGVSLKDINHIIGDALGKKNPEIAVSWTKRNIENLVRCGVNVVIDDTRRLREFVWLDALAERYGTKHIIVEIVPVGNALDNARLDAWTNGNEPCGYDVWKDRKHLIVENDGTELFDNQIIRIVRETLL